MDESIRELRIQLERKRGVLREKDNEIAQISTQVQQAAREEGTMSRELEQARSAGIDQNALFEKQGTVLRLKQQIDDLKAELRRAEKEVKKMESKSSAASGNPDFMEQQLRLKKDEQSTLRAVMEALEDEKKSAKREVDNIDSELKSLETIQMLAQGEDIG
jgi:chromosome segregation ATPase